MPKKKLAPKSRGEIEGVEFEVSSGNVFADLGFAHAEELQAKALLAAQIAKLLEGHTQKEAACLLGLDQPKVSKLLRGQLREFSTDRLLNLLTILGQNIEIRISPASRRQISRAKLGHISVSVVHG